MSERKLPCWLTGFVEFTEDTEACELFSRWIGTSCVAAALERKCSITFAHLTFYPNLYVVLIAPSGHRKGTAMRPGIKFLREAGIRLSANATTRAGLIEDMIESSAQDVGADGVDATYHASLTVFSEELTTFLGYAEDQMLSDLNNWYDCEDLWVNRTRGEGKEGIHGVWINIVSATTPALVQTQLPQEGVGGGFTSRIIFVFNEGVQKIVPLTKMKPVNEELRAHLQGDLERIHAMRGEFTVTPEFRSTYEAWYADHSKSLPFSQERYGGYCQRRPTHLIKLSMVLSASRSNDMVIEAYDFNNAVKMLRQVEERLPRVFEGMGGNKLNMVKHQVIAYLAVKKSVKRKVLMMRYHHEIDVQGLYVVLGTLKVMGSIKWEGVGDDQVIHFVKMPQEV